jgi:hypothetical protein
MDTPWTREGRVIPATHGKVSWFGGPDDDGVTETETLSLMPQIRARALNPKDFYIAMRWRIRRGHEDEDKAFWVVQGIYVARPDLKRVCVCRPVDWGPNAKTGRVADLSPGALVYLGLKTDDEAIFALASRFAAIGPVALS